MPGENFVHCGEPAILALVPSKGRNHTHTACSRIGRLIDNVLEGTFYSVIVYLAAALDALSAAGSLTNMKSMLAGTMMEHRNLT